MRAECTTQPGPHATRHSVSEPPHSLGFMQPSDPCSHTVLRVRGNSITALAHDFLGGVTNGQQRDAFLASIHLYVAIYIYCRNKIVTRSNQELRETVTILFVSLRSWYGPTISQSLSSHESGSNSVTRSHAQALYKAA